ncbi:hypothetical protein PTTG_28473 [Puccinia triticina 1-1 BBBD Race 1]|uniref:Uncharacterized protein n=1 Tax=Puccinia triticina (isolate 1-1 / race 1 (BBBD)) TaxID=630390 RepID=A0A180GBD4_PUCT1|nr:hypothetical protein PTTG_28473 [Puccinia triticina 1-1 BBBD Race 1]
MVSWCDLDAVIQSWVRKGGISDAVEYEAFQRVWDPIQSGLLRKGLIKTVDEICSCFYRAFSSKFQEKIQLILFKSNKLMFVTKKFFKFPPFEDIRAAAKEALLDQTTPTIKSPRNFDPVPVIPPTRLSSIVDEVSRMLRLLDDRLEKLESLEQRLKRVLSSPPASASAGKKQVICFYCHVEGHGMARCDALQKDKEGGLIDQKGHNYFLPSGALIPFDPTCPIRSIVALFRASGPSASPDHATYRSGCGALQVHCPPAVPAQSLSQSQASGSTRNKSYKPMSFGVPSESQPHPRRPIRNSPVPEFNQPDVMLPEPESQLCHTPSAQAVDSVLKRISEMIGPNLSVSNPSRKNSSTSVSMAIAPTEAVPGNLVKFSGHLLHPTVGCSVSSQTFNSNTLRDKVKLSSPTPITLQDEVKLSFPIPGSNGLREEVKLSPFPIPNQSASPPPIRLRDEVKLASQSSSDPTNQQPSFQSQIRLRNENKLGDPHLSFDSFPNSDPAECLCSPQVRLRNEGKLVPRCLGFPWRHRSIKVSPPNVCTSRVVSTALSKTLQFATFVSGPRVLPLLSSLDLGMCGAV